VRDFEFLTPTTASDASRMLADHGETARLLAGGTALLLVMRARLASPSHLVWLGEVPGLDRVALDARDGLTLGAMATHHAVETHAGIRAAYPMLAEMARRVANPHVRNAGTLGGNLCYGDPASDPPTCLLALDAEVRAVRGAQERAISLDGFFTDYYENALAPDEVLTEVRIPPMPPGAVGVYHRFTTTPAESRPLVGVGVVLVAGRDRVCRRARVAHHGRRRAVEHPRSGARPQARPQPEAALGVWCFSDRAGAPRRPAGEERREPERNVLNVREHRKRSRDEAGRDGSAMPATGGLLLTLSVPARASAVLRPRRRR